MNIIRKIAKFYGVDLHEEFYIVDNYGPFPAKYRFSTISGLEIKIQNSGRAFWIPESGYMLTNLLVGKLQIKKEDIPNSESQNEILLQH